MKTEKQMDVYDWCHAMSIIDRTYFPVIQTIEDQFDYGYHDREERYDFYNASLLV